MKPGRLASAHRRSSDQPLPQQCSLAALFWQQETTRLHHGAGLPSLGHLPVRCLFDFLIRSPQPDRRKWKFLRLFETARAPLRFDQLHHLDANYRIMRAVEKTGIVRARHGASRR